MPRASMHGSCAQHRCVWRQTFMSGRQASEVRHAQGTVRMCVRTRTQQLLTERIRKGTVAWSWLSMRPGASSAAFTLPDTSRYHWLSPLYRNVAVRESRELQSSDARGAARAAQAVGGETPAYGQSSSWPIVRQPTALRPPYRPGSVRPPMLEYCASRPNDTVAGRTFAPGPAPAL